MTLDAQINLFEDEQVNYLHVIKDNQVVKMKVKNIFDDEKYTILHAVTFVSSPQFFFNISKEFEETRLILGIGDGHISDAFFQGIAPLINLEERVDFFNQAPQSIKEKIRHQQYEIRYSRNGNPIHSKIYLLSNKDNNENRLVLGSANLTERAFANKNQYEEVLIFDNSSLFDIYTKRFKAIDEQTVDYIPDKLKRELDIITTPELLKEMLLDELINKRLHIELNEDDMEELKGIEEKQKQQTEEKVKLKEIVEVVTRKNKKENVYIPKTPLELDKRGTAIKNIYTKKNKDVLELDGRFVLEYLFDKELLVMKNENASSEEYQQSEFVPFSTLQERDAIKQQIKLVVEFVETYRDYTVREDNLNLSRIFEVVLYSLMSPYIWKMRDHCAFVEGVDSIRRDFPPFLVISGISGSGKTTLLEFISVLLGTPNDYYPYSFISSKKHMLGHFQSSNLMPLLVDEIETSFFTGKRGEAIIKDVASHAKGQHPVLIGTTNAGGFNTSEQVLSRIYYLRMNNTFDTALKRQASQHLATILNQVDDTLFKDFTYCVSQTIKNDETFYQREDILYLAREIFKAYFDEFNMQTPEWFPQGKFNDYREMAALNWLHLYQNNKEAFIDQGETLLVKLEMINQSYASPSSKDRANLINLLPDGCIKDHTHVLILYKQSFYDFIKTADKNIDKGFVKKMLAFFSNE